MKTFPATPIPFLYSFSHLLVSLTHPHPHPGGSSDSRPRERLRYLLVACRSGHTTAFTKTPLKWLTAPTESTRPRSAVHFKTTIYQAPTRCKIHILTVKGSLTANFRLISLTFCLKSSNSLAPYCLRKHTCYTCHISHEKLKFI